MNNITIGQYIPGKSWLHKLDPRIKIIILVLGIVSTFLIPIPTSLDGVKIWSIIGLGAILIINLICIITAKIPLLKVLRGIKGLIFLLVFMTIIQILSFQEGYKIVDSKMMYWSAGSLLAMVGLIVLYIFTRKYIKFKTIYFLLIVGLVFAAQAFLDWGQFGYYELTITSEGLIRSGFLFLRIVCVVIMTSILTFTTMTTDLNYGIESLLKPLKVIKIPVDTFAMLLSLTLRFIPTLMDETNKIMKAQASRGVDFKESKLKDKIVQIVSLLIPVLVVSIKRAEDLAQAMEVKGYIISAKRTRIDQFKIGFKDIFVLFCGLLLLGMAIAILVLI